MWKLVTVRGSPVVPLLGPELMLFPSIYFKKTIGDSSLGFVPRHFCLLRLSTSHNSIASIWKHTCIRVRNGSLGKITSDQHLHFAFNLKINAKLNKNSSKMVFKRDFEHLMEEGINGHEQTKSALEFDEFDSNRKVKELSYLMREIHGRHFTQSLAMKMAPLV